MSVLQALIGSFPQSTPRAPDKVLPGNNFILTLVIKTKQIGAARDKENCELHIFSPTFLMLHFAF
jgi:hypothetical protein